MTAAINLSIEGLVDAVVYLIILGVVFGILIFLVRRAPMIPAEWKTFIEYFIYFVAGLFLIALLLDFAGHPIIKLR